MTRFLQQNSWIFRTLNLIKIPESSALWFVLLLCLYFTHHFSFLQLFFYFNFIHLVAMCVFYSFISVFSYKWTVAPLTFSDIVIFYYSRYIHSQSPSICSFMFCCSTNLLTWLNKFLKEKKKKTFLFYLVKSAGKKAVHECRKLLLFRATVMLVSMATDGDFKWVVIFFFKNSDCENEK